jgi:hypothetical protein
MCRAVIRILVNTAKYSIIYNFGLFFYFSGLVFHWFLKNSMDSKFSQASLPFKTSMELIPLWPDLLRQGWEFPMICSH